MGSDLDSQIGTSQCFHGNIHVALQNLYIQIHKYVSVEKLKNLKVLKTIVVLNIFKNLNPFPSQ